MKVYYEAEKLPDGRALSLYRRVIDDDGKNTFEEYIIEEHKWKKNSDALGAFMGEIFTNSVDEDYVKENIAAWEENYKKYLENGGK